jgi:hypothetical protein
MYIRFLSLILLTGLICVTGCASRRGTFADLVTPDQGSSTVATPAVATVPAAPAAEPPASAPQAIATPVAEPSGVVVIPTTRPAYGALRLEVDAQGNLTRGFAPSVFERPSGNTIAGPMYWPMGERSVVRPDWQNLLLEPVEYVVDVVLMPFRAIRTPPWRSIEYDAVPADDTTPASSYRRRVVMQERPVQ